MSMSEETIAWKNEALALREGMAKLAEAFGWSEVRQENGDLHLPCAEDVITRAKQVNVNDEVWVKLTPAGLEQYLAEPARKVLREEHSKYAETVKEVMSFSLWELMNVFGSGFYNGGPALFEKQLLYFEDPSIPDVALVTGDRKVQEDPKQGDGIYEVSLKAARKRWATYAVNAGYARWSENQPGLTTHNTEAYFTLFRFLEAEHKILVGDRN